MIEKVEKNYKSRVIISDTQAAKSQAYFKGLADSTKFLSKRIISSSQQDEINFRQTF